MKSVLHIRLDSPFYNCDAMEAAFKSCGYQYYGLKWQQYRFESGIELLRKEVIKTASIIKPTLIFCHLQNGEVFDMETWKTLAEIGGVVNYTFDVRQKDEMHWMYDVAPHIKYTFFGCMEDVWHCIGHGINNTGHLHSSVDMNLYKPKEGKKSYAFDIVFCGNRYDNSNLKFPLAAERQEMISVLSDRYKSKFMPYGLGQQGGMVRPEVEANIYNFSRIAINQNNFMLNDYSSDRIWRIMASGTMCISKYFPGIEKIFKNTTHLVWWHNHKELTEYIDYYLSDEKERLAVAAMGTQLVRENHRWEDRFIKMEKIIAELK